MTVSLKHCSTIRKSIITARQRSCGMIMFSVVSVCHSVHQVGWGSHVTIIHDALGPHHPRAPIPNVGPQEPPLSLGLTPLDTRPYCKAPLPVPASDIWWSSLESCSSLLHLRTPTNSADIWWLLKRIRFACEALHPT